jgi:deoxyribodipyrimidine photo-lyase
MANAPGPAILWFRDDLRLADNPALTIAVASGRPLICLYVFDQESPGLRPLGGAARWWLHGALAELEAALAARGGRLVIRQGRAAGIVEGLAIDAGAGAVYWNRRYEAAGREIDAGLKAALGRRGIAAESRNGSLLAEPWTVTSQAGSPFRVFSAHWRALRRKGDPARPLGVPERLDFHALPKTLLAEAVDLSVLGLEPSGPDWAGGLRDAWQRGEAGGLQALEDFLEAGFAGYAEGRDRPDRPATGRLSPHLRFGTISVRQAWHAASAAQISGAARASPQDLEKFLAELGWRDFSYALLFHHPDMERRNLQPGFDAMPWRRDAAALKAWQRGRTGYPLVDAGMRELWTTGWMHNRVRMVAASFLAKHLLLDWRQGEAWFWDTLVDADPASNPANWQWVAGTGMDAAPYFRIFNPTLQGGKFDPAGAYVRHWVPELARLPDRLIHRPWAAEPGLRGGYPAPIVEHDAARRRALEAWRSLGGEAAADT